MSLLLCDVESCHKTWTEKVIITPRGRMAPETRRLCSEHAAQHSAWLEGSDHGVAEPRPKAAGNWNELDRESQFLLILLTEDGRVPTGSLPAVMAGRVPEGVWRRLLPFEMRKGNVTQVHGEVCLTARGRAAALRARAAFTLGGKARQAFLERRATP